MPQQIGNKTECALLGFVIDLGVDYRQVSSFCLDFFTSAANRLIGEVVQSRRRPLLALSHLRDY